MLSGVRRIPFALHSAAFMCFFFYFLCKVYLKLTLLMHLLQLILVVK